MVIGFAGGEIPTLRVNYVLLKNIEVSGLQVSDYRKRAPELMRHCYEEIFRLWGEGRLHAPPITTFALDKAPKALQMLRDRKAAGRCVLLPSDNSI